MMWHGHAAEGLLAAELTYPVVPIAHTPGTAAAYFAVAIIGVLAPDLDHREGKLTHSLGPVTWLLCRAFVYLSKAVYHLTRGPGDAEHTNGHRTLTHTPAFAPVLPLAAWAALGGANGPAVACGLLVGWLTHIAGDACTNSGVPALWPLRVRGASWRHYGIPEWLRFKTGGHGAQGGWEQHGEHIVTALAMVACFVVGAFYVDPHLLPQITAAL
ncbi:MAG TPA: metal-dependent hydrolase [Pseudonocardia sp.]|jgi:membrane-bound metal-dependent hydrolase YbcI (DUF457 family)